jgi:putrescine aminotransferase
MQAIVEERLPDNARVVGEHLLACLRDLRGEFPRLVADVRGQGLLTGIEVVDEETGVKVADRFFAHDVLVAHTLNNPRVVRVTPPLIITRELVDEVVSRFRRALAELSS